MTKETVERKARMHHPAATSEKEGFANIESYLPTGSPQRTAAEIVAAAGGALIAAAVFGVGPVALAGAAGYLVYHETHRH